MMFEPIARVEDLRKRFNHKMFTSGVSTFRGFEELEAKILADGALPRKVKELASIGISIVAGCYGCIEYHVTAALEQGATRQEVAEMAALAVCMGGGTAQWAARYVFDVLDQLEQGGGERR
jgi:AhpD family alkylhydroperoxidase